MKQLLIRWEYLKALHDAPHSTVEDVATKLNKNKPAVWSALENLVNFRLAHVSGKIRARPRAYYKTYQLTLAGEESIAAIEKVVRDDLIRRVYEIDIADIAKRIQGR